VLIIMFGLWYNANANVSCPAYMGGAISQAPLLSNLATAELPPGARAKVAPPENVTQLAATFRYSQGREWCEMPLGAAFPRNWLPVAADPYRCARRGGSELRPEAVVGFVGREAGARAAGACGPSTAGGIG